MLGFSVRAHVVGPWSVVRCCRDAVRYIDHQQLTTDDGQRTSMPLYPLKFKPRLVEKMWGGRKLEELLGKSLPPGKKIGESWQLYDFPPGVVEGSTSWISSEIANGPL